MRAKFSRAWKGSKKPNKQRKYAANAPLHTKRKMLSSRLSKELTTKHSKRNVIVKKGDKVKIMRGNFKNHSGTVERVLTKLIRVYVEGAQRVKRDGSKAYYPIHPSSLMIMELNLDDKKRQANLSKGKKNTGVGKKNE